MDGYIDPHMRQMMLDMLRHGQPNGRSVTTNAERLATANRMAKMHPEMSQQDIIDAQARAHMGDNLRQDVYRGK